MNISKNNVKELENQRIKGNSRSSSGDSFIENEVLDLMIKIGSQNEIKNVYALDVLEKPIIEIIKEQYNVKEENMYIHSLKHLENVSIKNIKRDYLQDPFILNSGELMKFSITLGLIPFGSRNREDFDFINEPHNRFWRGIPNKSREEYTYFSHIIETLEKNGKAVILCPTGTLLRQGAEEEIRKQIIKENIVEAIIVLPCKLLQSTSIQTTLLIINKNKKNNNVLFIDASRDFEETRSKNKLRQKDIDKIYNCYKNAEDIIGYSRRVSLQEIENNDFSLSAQLYVKEDETVETIDLDSLQVEISAIEDELAKVKEELNICLNDLGGEND